MTIKELYTAVSGDYDDVMRRMRSERMVRKFLNRFLEDSTFENLQKAMEAGQQNELFRAAHTLKGLGLNLGLSKLSDSSHRLTEAVRTELTPDADSLFREVVSDYMQTAEAIRALDPAE